jgi:hypothetical protein
MSILMWLLSWIAIWMSPLSNWCQMVVVLKFLSTINRTYPCRQPSTCEILLVSIIRTPLETPTTRREVNTPFKQRHAYKHNTKSQNERINYPPALSIPTTTSINCNSSKHTRSDIHQTNPYVHYNPEYPNKTIKSWIQSTIDASKPNEVESSGWSCHSK